MRAEQLHQGMNKKSNRGYMRSKPNTRKDYNNQEHNTKGNQILRTRQQLQLSAETEPTANANV